MGIKKKHTPGCGCCGGGGPSCSGCSSQAPNQWSVVFTNLNSNFPSFCDDCVAAANGTFVCDYFTSGTTGGIDFCEWRSGTFDLGTAAACNAAYIKLRVYGDGAANATIDVEGKNDVNLNNYYFTKTYAGDADCAALSNESIPRGAQTSVLCLQTPSGTCNITAI